MSEDNSTKGKVPEVHKKTYRLSLDGTGLMASMWSTAATLLNTMDLPFRIKHHRVHSSSEERGIKFAQRFGFEYLSTDVKEWAEDEATDIFGIVSRNTDHHPRCKIICNALQKRSLDQAPAWIWSEKPLGLSLKQGKDMAAWAAQVNAHTLVMQSYRGVPAVQLMLLLKQAGFFGEIVQVKGAFDQDWTLSPDVPQGADAPGLWRNTRNGGVNLDLNVHLLDLMLEFSGPLKEVFALNHQFNPTRPNWKTSKIEPCDCDDASLFTGKSTTNVLVSGGSSRGMRGEKATFTIQVSGRNGGAKWDFSDPHVLHLYQHSTKGFDPKALHSKTEALTGSLPSVMRGWTKVYCTGPDFPGGVWVPGTPDFGWVHSFLEVMRLALLSQEEGVQTVPSFRSNLRTLAAAEAIGKVGFEGGKVKVAKA
jgi:predicted dehydrogenase